MVDDPVPGDSPLIHELPSCVFHSILSCLGPRDLCCVTATCRQWHSLASTDLTANKLWKGFYAARWRLRHLPAGADVRWQRAYGHKMLTLRSWSGKFQQDSLYGHKLGVRCLKLLPSHNLLATGSIDKTVRLWDLAAGMPLSISRPHGGIVRSLAVDAQALVSGSSDNHVRVWHATTAGAASQPPASFSAGNGGGGGGAQPLFDLSGGDPQVLKGHRGPVSCLALTERVLYSGSWDYTLRAWSRGAPGEELELGAVFGYDDWVTGVAVRGPHLLVAAGPQVVVQDLLTGQPVRKFTDLHEGHVTCLEGTHNGRMLFTGSVDGLVLGHDLRMRHPTVVLWHHNAAVQGLALEDPWLVSASSDGTVMLLNTETQLRATARGLGSNCRQLAAPGGAAYCVDLSEQWLACGAEAETVRVWDFSKAAEAEARAAAARAGRGSRNRLRAAWAAAAPLLPPLPVPAAIPEASELPMPFTQVPRRKGKGRSNRSNSAREVGVSAAIDGDGGGGDVALASAHIQAVAVGGGGGTSRRPSVDGGAEVAAAGTAAAEAAALAALRPTASGVQRIAGGGTAATAVPLSRSSGRGGNKSRHDRGGSGGRERSGGVRAFAAPPPVPPSPRARAGPAPAQSGGGALGAQLAGGAGTGRGGGVGQGGFWYASISRSGRNASGGGAAAAKPGGG